VKTTSGLAPAVEWMLRVAIISASAAPTAAQAQSSTGPPRASQVERKASPVTVTSSARP